MTGLCHSSEPSGSRLFCSFFRRMDNDLLLWALPLLATLVFGAAIARWLLRPPAAMDGQQLADEARNQARLRQQLSQAQTAVVGPAPHRLDSRQGIQLPLDIRPDRSGSKPVQLAAVGGPVQVLLYRGALADQLVELRAHGRRDTLALRPVLERQLEPGQPPWRLDLSGYPLATVEAQRVDNPDDANQLQQLPQRIQAAYWQQHDYRGLQAVWALLPHGTTVHLAPVFESGGRLVSDPFHATTSRPEAEGENDEGDGSGASSGLTGKDKPSLGTCCICMSAASQVIFYPCRHALSCPDCAVELQMCPWCRNKIERALVAR